jgi:hypothetical protein
MTDHSQKTLEQFVLHLNSGLKDLDQDVQSTLEKVIAVLGTLAENIDQMSSARGRSRQAHAWTDESRQYIAHMITLLQVGDRAHQKVEGLRSVLQEFADYLFAGTARAPDLGVEAAAFDKNLLPKAARGTREKGKKGKALSQGEIDTLFG